MTIMTRFKIRRDTAANWTTANPVLLDGEPAIETDTRKVKYGDGSTAWNSLPYAAGVVLSDSLTAIGTLAPAADQLAYYTGTNTAALVTFTAYSRTLMDDPDAVTWRGTLGLGTAAVLNSGTSGGTVALCNGANTWSSTQTFASATFSGDLIRGGTSLSAVLSGGGASQSPNFQLQGTSPQTTSALFVTTSNTAVNCPILYLARAKTSMVAVQTGDRLGDIAFSGSDGSALRMAAYIRAEPSSNFTSGNAYGRLTVALGNGSGAPTEAFRFDPAGVYANNILMPLTDNSRALGGASNRWTEVFATNNVINTSDEREKQDIAPISDALLDAWAGVEWRTFRWIEAVEEKGGGARWHFGLIAQQVRDAIDTVFGDGEAVRLGFVCHDKWGMQPAETAPEMQVVDDEERETGRAIVTRPPRAAGDRWGLRYDQCFAVEAAYQRRRLHRIEESLAALEA